MAEFKLNEEQRTYFQRYRRNRTPEQKQKATQTQMRFQRKIEQQLGMKYAQAQRKLDKELLYEFAKRLGLLTCPHCHQEIQRQDFSIDHKTPWLDTDNPQELFYDLSNITFVHRACNSARARRRGATIN
jgi:hypothetical protein